MNGKKYFREACQQMGIDCDNNFVVVSQNHIQGNGYVCRYSHLNRKPSQLYIVNYIKERDIYIAWNLKERLGDKKDVFRVLTVGLNDLTQEAIKTIKELCIIY